MESEGEMDQEREMAKRERKRERESERKRVTRCGFSAVDFTALMGHVSSAPRREGVASLVS